MQAGCNHLITGIPQRLAWLTDLTPACKSGLDGDLTLGHARIGAGPTRKVRLLVGTKAEVPAAEIVVHLGVAVLSVLSMALIERLLHIAGLDGRKIPAIDITLSD